MTPKEKAEEICQKMLFQIEWNAQPSTVKGVAKQCALIAVDEILSFMDRFDLDRDMSIQFNRWQEVKQEIKKL